MAREELTEEMLQELLTGVPARPERQSPQVGEVASQPSTMPSFTDESERDRILQEYEREMGRSRIRNFITNLGDVIGSGDVGENIRNQREEQRQMRQDYLSQLDARDERALRRAQEQREATRFDRETTEFERAQRGAERTEALEQAKNDPQSTMSILGRKAVRNYIQETGAEYDEETLQLLSNGSVSQIEALLGEDFVANAINSSVEARRERERLAAEAAAKGPKQSETEKTLERERAKDYAEFQDAGGASAVRDDIRKLEAVILQLEGAPPNRLLSVLPESARAFVDEEGLDIEQTVASVTQKNLRQILGGQFAQREGQELVQRSYDPRLPADNNIKRLSALRNTMQDALDNRLRYFEEGGLDVRRPASVNNETGDDEVVDWNDL